MLQSKFLSVPAPNCVRILITSDVHLALDKVVKLGEWMWAGNSKREGVDFVLCCGDLTNMDPANNRIQELVLNNQCVCNNFISHSKISLNNEGVSACEGEMSAVVACLERVCAKVIYIPGNHDAKTTLSPDEPRPRLTTHSINLHYRCLRLTPDLVMVGLGGSVPGYQGQEQVWVGYPFTDEKQVEEALTQLLIQKAKNPAAGGSQNDEIAEGDTIILVSHVGPHNSDTTIDQVQYDAEPIQSGSHALRKTLLDPLIVRKRPSQEPPNDHTLRTEENRDF